MIKILWISPCCVHDYLNPAAAQVRNMIAALRARGAVLAVLTSTIRTSTAPSSVAAVVREPIAHSNTKFQLLDGDVPYVYTTTASNSLGDMTVLEQRNFYNEMTPIICGFKPDLVIASSSDIVTMSCLNLARQCHLPTAFVLLEHPTFDYSFRDSDLILATSQFLIDSYVTPQGRSATYIGPFIKVSGPLLTGHAALTGAPNQAKKATAQAGGAKAVSAKAVSTKAVSAKASTASDVRAQLKAFAQEVTERQLILLVNPSLENGLGLFLELVKQCRSDRQLFSYQFAVLEREPEQFAHSLNEYYDRHNGQKSYDLSHFSYLKVYPYTTNLGELLTQTRVLVMPTLSYDCAPAVALEAISYGVSVVTTDQPTLQEFLGAQATYIDVGQDVIDHLTNPPQHDDVTPWFKAVKAQVNHIPELKTIKELWAQNSYEANCKRLCLALKPLTEQHASSNPQLLRTGAFSLRAIIKAELDARAQVVNAVAAHVKSTMSDEPSPKEEVDSSAIFNTPSFDTVAQSTKVVSDLRRSLIDANVLAGNEYVASLVTEPDGPAPDDGKLQAAVAQANAHAASSYLSLTEAAKKAFSTARDPQELLSHSKLGRALAQALEQQRRAP